MIKRMLMLFAIATIAAPLAFGKDSKPIYVPPIGFDIDMPVYTPPANNNAKKKVDVAPVVLFIDTGDDDLPVAHISRNYWHNGSGVGSENYWKNGTGPGSLSYWNNGTDKGSEYYWKNGTNAGSEYHWKLGSSRGSKGNWESGSGPGTKSAWGYGTGIGSKLYWESGNKVDKDLFIEFTAVCMGLAQSHKQLPEICKAD